MDVVVVGAGISGVSCARVLRSAGIAVTVLDRGRVVGGRMASKRHDGRPVDIGASYFTVSDPEFEAVVADWERRGLARPWTDTFDALSDAGRETKTGTLRWAAPAGLRSLVTDLAADLQVRGQTAVSSVDLVDGTLRVDGVEADAVVLAMPDPQARRTLSPALSAVAAALTDEFLPVLALTAIYADRSWELDGAFVNDHPTINWIADDGRRRGDDAPVLVAHSTPEFARSHLTDPAGAAPAMIAELREILELSAHPVLAEVHRWTFGKPAGHREEPYFLGADTVGVCGDAWSTKPRVESAFLSGQALGRALVQRLTGSAP